MVVTVALPLGRHHRQPASLARGHRAPLHERDDAHDGGTEFRDSLGEPERFAGTLQGAASRGLGDAGRRRHRRTSFPARARTPASWGSRLRAGWRRNCASDLAEKSFQLDEAVEQSAHQDQRLLQQLRPAPRGRPRLLRRQPQDGGLRRAALPGGARRRVGAQRRARTACRSRRFRRRIFRRWSRA